MARRGTILEDGFVRLAPKGRGRGRSPPEPVGDSRLRSRDTGESMPDYTDLLRTSDVLLGASRCRPADLEPEVEETEACHTLVFPVEGVFSVDTGTHRTSATPSKVLFFHEGQTHRVRHPRGDADRSIYACLSRRLVEPFTDADGCFRLTEAFTDPLFDLRLMQLAGRAGRRELTPLELDEFVLDTLGLHIDDHSRPASSTSSHREIARAADEHLAVHFRDDCDLSHVARDVGVSPHHLSRVFKAVTGTSLTRRRTRLRLRYALEQIVSGCDDLTAVAVEAGFYDHPHMANNFRAHLGISPSMARLDPRSARPPTGRPIPRRSPLPADTELTAVERTDDP